MDSYLQKRDSLSRCGYCVWCARETMIETEMERNTPPTPTLLCFWFSGASEMLFGYHRDLLTRIY